MQTQKLAEIIYEYSIRSKYLDSFLLTYFIESYVKENKLNYYVNNCIFNYNSNKEFLSSYNYNDKTIATDYQHMINVITKSIDDEKYIGVFNSEVLRTLKVNLEIITTMVHELTHAYQYKKCFVGKYDIKKQLLGSSLFDNLLTYQCSENEMPEKAKKFIRDFQKLYNDNAFYYQICPHERMAKIEGIKFVNKLIKNSSVLSCFNLSDYIELKYLLTLLNGYDDLYGPTSYFDNIKDILKNGTYPENYQLELDKYSDKYKRISKENSFSLYEKLYYGMPINMFENQVIQSQLKLKQNKVY